MKHPLYAIWADMKSRCINPRHQAYRHYGARGIKVCDRWRDSFEAFVADLPPKPGPEYSIDRVDNDGHYEPGNVKWSTPKEQANNRRIGLIKANSIVVGDTNLWELCRRARVSYYAAYRRIKQTAQSPLLVIGHLATRRGFNHPVRRYFVDGLSLREVCHRKGLRYLSVYKRMRKFGESPQQAVAHFEQRTTRLNPDLIANVRTGGEAGES
jgi:hypothetical protein